ncbi:MAG TPA: hydrogenase maturation nickel metallochaperone HypA [Actinomycetota bacterium]
MHDYHAVHALVERLTGELDPAELEAVARVRIRAGAAFSPEALMQAYEMLTLATPLEGSRLVVEGSTDRAECPTCGHAWAVTDDDLAGHWLACPSCGALCEFGTGAGLEVVGITSAGSAEPTGSDPGASGESQLHGR